MPNIITIYCHWLQSNKKSCLVPINYICHMAKIADTLKKTLHSQDTIRHHNTTAREKFFCKTNMHVQDNFLKQNYMVFFLLLYVMPLQTQGILSIHMSFPFSGRSKQFSYGTIGNPVSFPMKFLRTGIM